MHVRKGDVVLVISGNDKGKTGEVKLVDIKGNRVLVDGVNLRWKHRPRTEKNPKGERVQIERSIHASNVMYVDPESGDATRKRPRAGKNSSKTASKAARKAAKGAK